MVGFELFYGAHEKCKHGPGELWALRAGLEQEYAIKKLANCHIASASGWIIRSGMRMYGEALKEKPSLYYEGNKESLGR